MKHDLAWNSGKPYGQNVPTTQYFMTHAARHCFTPNRVSSHLTSFVQGKAPELKQWHAVWAKRALYGKTASKMCPLRLAMRTFCFNSRTVSTQELCFVYIFYCNWKKRTFFRPINHWNFTFIFLIHFFSLSASESSKLHLMSIIWLSRRIDYFNNKKKYKLFRKKFKKSEAVQEWRHFWMVPYSNERNEFFFIKSIFL